MKDGHNRTVMIAGAIMTASLMAAAGAWSQPAEPPGEQVSQQAREQAQDRQQQQAQDRVYGWQLMTRAERNEYRQRMQNATTREERERIRAEHHAAMQARARERGVQLPDDMPGNRSGKGMQGSGQGPGAGSRPGGGKGGGKGPGR